MRISIVTFYSFRFESVTTINDFLGIPNSGEEADRMISLGILPTHTIVLNNERETEQNKKKFSPWSGKVLLSFSTGSDDRDAKTTHDNRQYENSEFEIKMKFWSTLKVRKVDKIIHW